jgi:hypothetical protein
MQMTDMLRRRLRALGWKTLGDAEQAEDGSWSLVAQSDGHTIVALADTRQEVWSAASLMAMRLAREGYGHAGVLQ